MAQISLSLPVPGQPNTSEDPKVVNDMTILQTLLNGNVDSTNLSPTAAITRGQQAGGFGNLALTNVSGTTSAVDGKYYNCTGAFVLTLPAPTLNATVGVRAANGQTGTAAVSITISSGGIYGLGCFGVSVILLGIPGAFVVLQGDGANWNVVAGGQDTGWVPLTLPGGVSSAGVTPAARLIGNIVWLQGSAQTSATIPIGSTVATVPAAMVPSATKSSVGWASNMALSMLVGSGTGAISFGFAWSNVYTAEFGGVTYAL